MSRWFRAVLCGLALSVPAQAVPAGYSEYLIPFGAEQLWSVFTNMDNDPVLVASGGTSFGLHCAIGISISTPNTTIYYDHWEDGLDFNPANVATADETFVGATRGQVIKLESSNIPVSPRGTTLKYDGRDRIYVAGGAITVSMSYWPESVGTVYADAWEIYPTKQFQTAYTIPVGQDLAAGTTNYEDFNRCYIVVQASEDSTTVTIDDPLVAGVQVSTTLNKGQVTQYLNSNSGTTISANKPVQVQYITGQAQAGAYAECRGYTAVPSTIWDTAYYCPVPSGGNADGDGNNYRTEIYIQNPTASALSIRWRDSTGTGTANVPANSTRSYTGLFGHNIPTNSGACIEAVDGVTKFNAIGAGNSLNITGNANANYDFGFSLVPANLLRNEYFLGWAPGTRTLANNGSPAFISPINDGTTIFVDWNADGIPEQTQTLNSLEVLKGRDTGDNDNSGMRITATGPIAVVWGEDATLADATDPYLDVGYCVIPQLDQNIDIVLSADKTANPTSIPKGVGQTSTFTLVTRTSGYTVDDVSVVDTLPAGWAYVAGSTTITLPGGTTISGANANPAISGQVLTWNDFSPGAAPSPNPLDMLANQTLTITFQGITTSTSATGFSSNQMASAGARGAQTFTATDDATVYVAELAVMKASSAAGNTSPGSAITYTMTLSNLGTKAQNNIIVSDPLPAGTSYVAQSTTVSIPAATGNYRDEFATAAYNNTSGNVDWTGAPWVETGDNNNATSGKVQITGGLLRFGGVNADTTTDEVTRIANLSTFGTLSGAILTFNLTNSGNLEAADTMTVQYSPNGSTWTTFTGGSFAGNAATGAQSLTIPPAAIGAGTRIRFQAAGLGDGTTEFIHVDNVNVAFTSTAVTRDNIPGGVNPDVSNGVPPNLVVAADSLDLLVPGGTMVVTIQATVNNPTPANQSAVVNTVTLTSTEQPAQVSSTVTDQLPPVTLGDFVFNDANANGVQDPGETGLAGMLVSVYRPGFGPDGIPGNADDSNVVSSLTTPASGAYSFPSLPAGTYQVGFGTLSGYIRTLANQGADDTKDSDADITTGRTGNIALTSGQSNLTIDAGYYQPGTVFGHLYIDTNGNGTQNSGEPDLANVNVIVTDSLGTLQTVSTDANGDWTATVPPGSTSAKLDETDPEYPTGFTQTEGADPTVVTAVAGSNINAGIDGYYIPGSISGIVLADVDDDGDGDIPLEGVVIRLLDSIGNPVLDGLGQPVTTTTLADGTYGFGNVTPGDYCVVQNQPANYNSVSDTDGPNDNVIGNVTPITVTGGNNHGGNDFIEIELGVINGYVRLDTDNNGNGDAPLPGVVLNLLDGSGNPVLDGLGAPIQVATNASGFYQFSLVPTGTYRVSQNQPAGYGSVSDVDGANNNLIGDEALIVMTPGLVVTNRDFVEIEFGAISGRVFKDTNDDGTGDTVFPGVSIALLDGAGNPVDADPVTPGVQPRTATTGIDGSYYFGNLFPGDYEVSETQPSGFGSVSDVDGGNPDRIGNITPITVNPGQQVIERDFVEIELGTISGYVYVGSDPLAGVTLTLLDENGDPVDGDPNTPGVQPVTTVTSPLGFYQFTGVIPGIYQVAQTQPLGYDSFGDIDGGDINIIGDVTPITLAPGQHSQNNNFVETLDTCPDDWAEWKFQHPGEDADGNPDADAYDNLAEFAFAMPAEDGSGSPWLGNTAWIIRPSTIAPGTLEGVFIRPKGAPINVTYTLQYAATPGNPTVWQSIVITPSMITTVDNGDCTETVTIHDLETVTGLTGGTGTVRIKADLDEDPPTGTDHSSYSEVEGWKETPLELCCRTYNNPYLRETAFTGTVSGVSGHDLTFAISGGGADLSLLLGPGASCYLEVTSGDNEGQRFDIDSATGNTVTLANDSSLHAAAAPFNTLTGAPPVSLAGDSIAIRRHWTLGEIFPATGFGATGSQSSADQIQVFAGGAWTIYWLYDENDADPATARWVDAANSGMADQGATVIQPGQGVFFNNRTAVTSILAYGEIRENDFIRPLAVGSNLVGGGYPVDQSADGALGRAMNTGTGFFGSRDFKTADSIFVWKADTTIGAPGYDTYFLLNGAPSLPSLLRWVKVGDASLLPRDAEIILSGNRSVFARAKNAVPAYTVPSPWMP